MRSITSPAIIIAITIIIVGIIGMFSAYLNETIADKASITETSSTQVLTFTGNVTDGELINISTYTFEFDVDGSVGAGNIPITVTTQGDGTVDQTIAVTNATTAINNNASVAALVSAASS